MTQSRVVLLALAAATLVPAAARAQAPSAIFRDDFESGTLSAWPVTATDSGDLAVSPSAAMGGTTLGLSATINDTNPLYVQDTTPNGAAYYRGRFWINPAGFDPGEAQAHFRVRTFILFQAAPQRRLAAVVLKRQGGQYSLMARARLDSNVQVQTGFTAITAGPHLVELEWRRSTTTNAGDGSVRFFIDGVAAGALTALDVDAAAGFARLGALSLKTGASGTLAWDEYRFYAAPALPRPQVVINELNANVTGSCDLVELRVLSSGDMVDYILRDRSAGILTFGPLAVTQNDIVVVHENSASATCNPGSAGQETTSISQYANGIFAANYDTAWDWYSGRTGLANTNDVLVLSDDLDHIQDAVLLADAPTGTTASVSNAAAAVVAAAGEWQVPGGGVPLGGFVDDAFRANAVLDLNATSTSALTGNSIQRTSDTDGNDKNDWTTGSGVPETFGVLNGGQSPCCVVSVVDIQQGTAAPGAFVILNDKRVTAITADRKHLWVADSATAGAYDGIFVFRGVSASPLDAAIGVGMSVSVSGTATEFSGPGFVDPLTEVTATSVTLTSGTTVPLTPVALAAATASSEVWEGVLVQITNLKVIASAAGDRLTLQDNAAGTIVMDDTAFDYSSVSYPLGTCFGSVTGVMSVADVRYILPRSAADLPPGFGCN